MSLASIGPYTLENRASGTCTSASGAQLFSTAAANRLGILVVNTNFNGALVLREGNQTTEAYTVAVIPPRSQLQLALGDAESIYVFAEHSQAGTLNYTAFELVEAC